MKMLSHLIVTLLLMAAASLHAQTVYRCGNSYSQTPCPGGNAVDATDSRTPEQRKAHEASVKHEKRAADSLEKTRQKEEAAAQHAASQADKTIRATEKTPQKADKKKAAPPHKIPAYRAPESGNK